MAQTPSYVSICCPTRAAREGERPPRPRRPLTPSTIRREFVVFDLQERVFAKRVSDVQVWVQRFRGGAPQEDSGCSGEKRREHPVQTQRASGKGRICTFSLELKPLRAAEQSGIKCVCVLQVLVDLSSEDISKGWTHWWTFLFYLCSVQHWLTGSFVTLLS